VEVKGEINLAAHLEVVNGTPVEKHCSIGKIVSREHFSSLLWEVTILS